MTIANLELSRAGYRCRRCFITVFGWKLDKLCTSCRCAEEGYRQPTPQDKTNDQCADNTERGGP